MSRHKHSPQRYRNYFQTHEQRLGQLYDTGFVLSDNLKLTSVPGAVLMEGSIYCQGNVVVHITKRIQIIDDSPDPLVQTVEYSYCMVLSGVGNIVRFDSGHPTHNCEHHKHSYDIFGGDVEGTYEPIYDPDERPTISDVVMMAYEWFYDNRDRLIALGYVLPNPTE